MLLEFMYEGGVLMWPLLALGVFTIVAAVRRALSQDESFDVDRLARVVLTASLAWSALGMRYASRAGYADVFSSATELDLRIHGFSEALAPAILGLAMFAIITAISSLPSGEAVRP